MSHYRFGLAASLCWGSGDFSGGLASRRAYVGSVVLIDYAVGLVLLLTLALIWREPFTRLRTYCGEDWPGWWEC